MPTSRLNILVAEDRPDEAVALQTLLRREGHLVRIAADGEAALLAAIEEPPEVMLLDIDLPKLDGCSVAAAARSVKWRRRPVVVTLTGHDGDDNRRRAAAAGVDLYLTKPVDLDTLRAILGRVMRPPVLSGPVDAPTPAAQGGSRRIRISCPRCDGPLMAAAYLAGQSVRCHHCQAVLNVPVPAAAGEQVAPLAAG